MVVLKDEVALSREFFESETKQRMDTVFYQIESLEARWKTSQSDRAKLDVLLDFINLHGKKSVFCN